MDDVCCQLKKPFVYGSAEGWRGQVSVFHLAGAGGYRDLFPEAPPVCEHPPGVMGPMPGLVGTRQALEVIKIITGVGEPLVGKLWMTDVLTNTELVLQMGCV